MLSTTNPFRHLCAAWALSLAVLIVSAPDAIASGPPYGIPSGVWPGDYWKYYRGYKNPSRGYASRPARPVIVSQAPSVYTVQAALVPYQHEADDPNIAIVMAHVPDDAAIWFGDALTRLQGDLRYFESPPLKPGRSYEYAVRVAWFEEGQWVARTINVPVRAGEVRCVYLVQADQAKELAEITANLEKLSPEDHRLALRQKVCAVQTDKPLGSMGVPVKVVLKGQPVFLCCGGCVKQAQSNPDQTLDRLQRAKAKDGPASSP